MLSLVPDSVATARRDADDVRIAQDVCDGRLSSIELDYSRRGRDRHCLVALPPLPAEVADIRSPIWLRMSAQYEAADDGTMDPRRPFTLFVTWFAGGVAISEERHRFHAGAAEAALCLRLEGDPEADCYQVTFYSDRSYGGALTIGDPHIVADGHVFRFAAGRHAVTRIDRRKRWSQRGRRVSCRAFFGEHFADMPVGWSLDEVHPAALAMAEWFLYAKIEAAFFGEDVAAPVLPAVGGRPAGDRTLLSFSLGTDSTAAAALLPPDTQAYYCKRAYEAYLLPSGAEVSLPPHRIYAAGLARMPSLVIVPNTFEAIGLRAGQRHGYAHGFGYAAIGLLLADHVGAGILAFGSVMEQVFLRSGNVYTDVVRAQASSFNTLGRTLRTAGLELALPTGGCSEVITERVAATGRYAGLAISCPRPGPRGEPCGTCFKCFRKLRLEGVANLPEPDGQVLKVLDTYPLKSATSVVFASQRAGYSYPSIERYLDADLGFLERYYGYAIEHMLPVHLRGPVQAELAALGIRQMSSSDEHDLRSVARVFWPEKFRP